MGEVLGLGLTHQPTLTRSHLKSKSLEMTLQDPGLPDSLRDPSAWPKAMQAEWADDRGVRAAEQHREELVEWFRLTRRELDRFEPDFVVIWGDDQYENFREDVVPPFCVLAYEDMQVRPWDKPGGEDNYWGEPSGTSFAIRGHREGAKYLTSQLLQDEFDMSYAYEPLHAPLGHAFLNTVLYLDWDRQGFGVPVVPFQVNCYGSKVIAQKGYRESLEALTPEAELDPPAPSPSRCLQLGAATARAFARSPWRVALVASSSWSHAFLTRKNHFLHPDHERDLEFYDALSRNDYAIWEAAHLSDLEESGQHELLNWFCLLGAMKELGQTVDESAFVGSYVMNSNKVFAVYRP